MIKEACVETVEQCVVAEKKGADRVELCADLVHDGLTPNPEVIRQAFQQLTIPIRVMIRPRAGDFVYSQEEVTQMKRSIDFCKSVGVEGVVFGACTREGTLDSTVIKVLTEYAKPLKVTIHKAIDSCKSPLDELKRLKELKGIDGVLTSGKASTAMEGIASLRSLVALAGDNIEVIACGKVTDENLPALHKIIQARAYHGKRIVGPLI